MIGTMSVLAAGSLPELAAVVYHRPNYMLARG